MEATDIDHNLVVVDEFDALFIDVNVADPALKDESPKKYPAKLHARRVAEELGAENGIIYLPGQLESTWEDSDQGPPFRQRRYFYYLTGVNFPGCSVTYDIAADKLTLWIPYTPPATILWFGNTPSPEDCLAISDVHDVKYVTELPAYLNGRLATVGTLYALRSSQLPKFDGFEQMKPCLKIDATSLQPAMDEARVIKTEHELTMIRKANIVSAAAHKKVATLMYGMKNECEIEAAFIAACTAQNAHAQAYPVIAGSGANASTLHYEANNESLIGKQLVVVDAGTEWSCYASDVTRTLPIGPRSRFSAEARAIYDLVHKMQEECIQRVKPGVLFRDLQLHATLVAVEGLLKLGILRNGTAEEIFKNGTGAAFFPHGLGHHVGLDVHDVLSKDLLRPAGEGMWGKRRPIGPQSVRAMIKQAANEAAAAAATSSPAAPELTTSTPPQTSSPPSRSSTPSPAPALPPRSSASSPSPTRRPLNGRPSPPAPNGGISRLPTRKSPQGKTACAKPIVSRKPAHSRLQAGMVVTVEPGVYFCRPYIEAYFLRREEHARYIDPAALERFWAVGGARVEDVVLVTPDGGGGGEVLSAAAPKGDQLLRLMGFA